MLTQSVFGRALGFGDLKILTASEAAISEFRMLRRPIEFKKAMLEAKHEYEIEVAGGTPAPAPPLRAEPLPAAAAGGRGGGRRRRSATTRSARPRRVGAAARRRRAAATDADEVTRTLASLADLRDRGAISARGVRAQEGGPARPALSPARRSRTPGAGYHTRDPPSEEPAWT